MDKGEKRFDELIKLAELAAARHDARRDYEWKIVIGFWVAMLMTLHKDWVYPERLHWAWFVLAVVFFSMTWVWGVFHANSNDKARYERYLQEAEAILKLPKDGRKPLIRGLWAALFQIGATAIIAGLIYFAKANG